MSKINWKRVWEQFDEWWKLNRYNKCSTWEKQQAKIQKIVDAELKRERKEE